MLHQQMQMVQYCLRKGKGYGQAYLKDERKLSGLLANSSTSSFYLRVYCRAGVQKRSIKGLIVSLIAISL